MWINSTAAVGTFLLKAAARLAYAAWSAGSPKIMNEMRPAGGLPWADVGPMPSGTTRSHVKIAASARISLSTPTQAGILQSVPLRPQESLPENEQQQHRSGHDSGAGHQQRAIDDVHLL